MRKRATTGAVAAAIAVACLMGVAAPANAVTVSGAGPFATQAKCNGERAIWRADGWTPSSCYSNNGGRTWWFTATK